MVRVRVGLRFMVMVRARLKRDLGEILVEELHDKIVVRCFL